jgi:hypothetical protein
MNQCPAVTRILDKIKFEDAVEEGLIVVVPEMDADNARLEVTDLGLNWLLDDYLEEYAFEYVQDNPPDIRDERD